MSEPLLCEYVGCGTLDAEQNGVELKGVPCVHVRLPPELHDVEHGAYTASLKESDSAALFGVHLGAMTAWVPVPPEVVRDAESFGALAIATGEPDDAGDVPYWLITFYGSQN